nr:hypothetical protein [Candidatus Sigynarchaeota archaeon]
MHKIASTTVILSGLALAVFAGVIFVTPGAGIEPSQGSTSPYIDTADEWWNSSDTYFYADDYNWTYQVWGCNATGHTYFDVLQETSERTETSQSWNDFYYYIYLDYTNSQTTITNVSDASSIESEGVNFTGGQAYYYVWVWMSYYTYTTQFNKSYTIWNLACDADGNIYTDENDTYIRQPGVINPSNFHPDNDTYDGDTGDSDWYDEFFDTYNGNETLANETYTEFSYGYEIYQYSGTWVEVESSGSAVSSAMHAIFEGYSLYEDKNANGRVDVYMTEDPEWPGYYYVSSASEWAYNLYYTNMSSFDIVPVVNGTNSKTFSFTLTGIGAGLVNYTDSYGLAYAESNITYCYIPQETTEFAFDWNATQVNLKVSHSMSKIYDWKEFITNGNSTAGLEAPHVVKGMSLSMNYWGDSWSESSNWAYTETPNATESEYVSNDTYSFSAGGTDIMQIDASGTYLLNGTATRDLGLVVMPEDVWSAQSNYYESSGEDTATGSYQWSSSIYVFGVTLNDWSGGSFHIDPVFSTLIRTQSSNTTPPVDGYSVLVMLGVSAAISGVLAKRFIKSRKE